MCILQTIDRSRAANASSRNLYRYCRCGRWPSSASRPDPSVAPGQGDRPDRLIVSAATRAFRTRFGRCFDGRAEQIIDDFIIQVDECLPCRTLRTRHTVLRRVRECDQQIAGRMPCIGADPAQAEHTAPAQSAELPFGERCVGCDRHDDRSVFLRLRRWLEVEEFLWQWDAIEQQVSPPSVVALNNDAYRVL